jgi:predicted nucleic-acid-binding Zn-ribbon protein
MIAMNVKCNKCGYVGDEKEFPTGRDFFQSSYIAKCPKCDNRQNPGDASMRMFGGERPFVYVRGEEPKPTGDKLADAVPTVMYRANEAS